MNKKGKYIIMILEIQKVRQAKIADQVMVDDTCEVNCDYSGNVPLAIGVNPFL